jgi:hypothetical protein
MASNKKRRADTTCEPEPDPYANAYSLPTSLSAMQRQERSVARSSSQSDKPPPARGGLSAREEGCSANRDGDTTERRAVTFLDAQERIDGRIPEDKKEGELSDSQISEEIGRACCNVSGCTRATWNGLLGEQCCRTCKASSGKSHGPDCEESCLSARMFAGSNSKRVPLAPLPSNSRVNQGWVSWRDASGDLVMAEKGERGGKGAQDEGKNASASDEEDELSPEDNFVTITGSCA